MIRVVLALALVAAVAYSLAVTEKLFASDRDLHEARARFVEVLSQSGDMMVECRRHIDACMARLAVCRSDEPKLWRPSL